MSLPRLSAYLCALALACLFACKSGEQTAAGESAKGADSKADPKADAKAGPAKAKAKAKAELSPLPEVIATVGGEPIPRSEFDLRYEPGAKMILSRRDDGVVPVHYQAMQRRKLIALIAWSKQMELEAKASGVDYDPAELAKQEALERSHVRDWPAWLERVGQTEQVRHQANVDYFRERALFASRGVTLEATDEQLRAFYDANQDKFQAPDKLCRASHLLLTFGPREADEKIQPVLPDVRAATSEAELAKWDELALARAKALREAVMAPGVDFNDFAREYSEGPGAFRGGDMGLFPYQQMVPEYAEAAFNMKAGELSEPIKSDKGYYVIKSFGCFEAGPLPFEAVRADLVRTLEAQTYEKAHADLKAELDGRFAIVSATLEEAEAFKSK